MFAVVFICGNLFLRIAEKIAKHSKNKNPQKFCASRYLSTSQSNTCSWYNCYIIRPKFLRREELTEKFWAFLTIAWGQQWRKWDWDVSPQAIRHFILLHEKFLQFDWLRAVVFQLNLKSVHVKITNLLRVVV